MYVNLSEIYGMFVRNNFGDHQSLGHSTVPFDLPNAIKKINFFMPGLGQRTPGYTSFYLFHQT